MGRRILSFFYWALYWGLKQIRVGYGLLLLISDLIILMLLIIDLLRFKAKRLDLSAAVEMIWGNLRWHSLRDSLMLGVFLIAGLPMAIGVIRVVTKRVDAAVYRDTFRVGVVRFNLRLILLIQAIFACICVVYLFLSDSMEKLSGYSLNMASGHVSTDFVSLISLSSNAILAICGTEFAVFSLSVLLDRLHLLKLYMPSRNEYITNLRLADLGSEYYPNVARNSLNFNSGGAAPELRIVRRLSNRKYREYQRSMPGSIQAASLLEKIWREAVHSFVSVVNKPIDIDCIELYPGTSRALEVALHRAQPDHFDGRKKKRNIIISPFEHHSSVGIAEWIATLTRRNTHFRNLKKEFRPKSDLRHFYCQSLENRVNEAIRLLRSALRDAPDGEPKIILLSEVCFVTGALLPILEIKHRVLERLSPDRRAEITFVIDSAHYTPYGFAGVPDSLASLADWDSVVISAHKWFLSPDPCGIVVSKGTSIKSGWESSIDYGKSGRIPFDGWTENLPESTSSARMLISLAASLEAIQRLGTTLCRQRSEMLRNIFERSVADRFVIVGATDPQERYGPMRAIFPRGHKWKGDDNWLEAQIKASTLNVNLLKPDFHCPWLRLSFAFFLEPHHVEKTCELLKSWVD